MRTLVVIRHAKAEQYAASDFERELTDRGRADAAEAGRWLASEGVVPGAAYVSPAARTRGTWAAIAEAAGWDLTPTYDRGLYGTDEEGVLELVQLTDEAVDTVVVIGHNPTIEMVVQMLDDGEGPADVAESLAIGYPTSAVTVFDVDVPWPEVGQMTARPRAFHVGRS
ncbi:MAG TPA: histidine phosphatase family protein [Nocardioides sp.]|nr:histidine phosphatase family protein [Nocardioides sp.]